MFFSRSLVFLPVFGLWTASYSQQPTPSPPSIREEVVVAANRTETRLSETPASVVTVARAEIRTTAAPVIDDMLRQVAGFSTFRRTSSRQANPTAQGVSLRGTGASGASRSTILFDGVPLNDPFGGWVQWNRVPVIEVDRIEVLRGGASGLYGDAGLSGAVNIFPRAPYDTAVEAELFGGTQKTLSGSGFAALANAKWHSSITAVSFQTRGYRPVEDAARGPVDSFAGARTGSLAARVGRSLGTETTIFLRPSYFGEVRSNGTGLQTNRTHLRQVVFGGDVRKKTTVSWRSYGGTQVFDQVFSAVNAVRTAESLTRIQRVPVSSLGASVQLSRPIGTHTIVAGGEIRYVSGSSDEIAFVNDRPSSLVNAGGRQTLSGFFFQDLVHLGSRLVIAGSLRLDGWSNSNGSSATRTLSTGQTATAVFPNRNESAVSPQLSLLYKISTDASFYASASRGFRSPTLNELYRSFRVGNVLTLANHDLRSERATNYEGGVTFGRRNVFTRLAFFHTTVERPVANVTLTTTPTLITRQRQNMGESRSRGAEGEIEFRWKRWTVGGGYLFADARVTDFPANRAIAGLMIPQVARHQATIQLAFRTEKWVFGAQARRSGSQFDDDLNQLRLEPFGQLDLFGSRSVSEHIDIFAAVENVFNSRYSTGRTPIRTVAGPTNVRVGVRFK